MKKTLLSLVALAAALTLSAQEIRTNYRSEGMTHISTEAEPCQDLSVRVERVGFPDGSTLYQLFIDLRQKTGFTAPKGVKMTATLPSGAVVRADQIGQESATKTRQEDGLYLNRLRYALEASDMEKLTRGVSDLELVTGWDPDNYLQYHFKDDAFAALLKRHWEAIDRAAQTTIELTAEPAGRVDLTGSIMTAATPLVAEGNDLKYNLILNHLYYKNSAKEDIDLAFQLGTEKQYRIEPDAPVTFVLGDGTEITFPQTRDEVNFIYLYPTLSQLRALAYGNITALRIQTEDGTLTDAILDNSFSKALNQQYQLLMSLPAL
ncbi:MAG: hypothetical protein IK098_07930 [Bacteroidales bacterium]|nr:hypothetical protein [Bacteroidales bacterium]